MAVFVCQNSSRNQSFKGCNKLAFETEQKVRAVLKLSITHSESIKIAALRFALSDLGKGCRETESKSRERQTHGFLFGGKVADGGEISEASVWFGRRVEYKCASSLSRTRLNDLEQF